MGRVGDTGVRLPAVGLLALLLVLAATSAEAQNTVTCGETVSSYVDEGGNDDWTFTSLGGAVQINTCSTGGDTKLKISGIWCVRRRTLISHCLARRPANTPPPPKVERSRLRERTRERARTRSTEMIRQDAVRGVEYVTMYPHQNGGPRVRS